MTTRLNSGISINNPADLVAAVPPMLGFAPTNSLVLLTVHGLPDAPRFGTTMRVDLPCPGQRSQLAAHLLAGPLRTHRPDAVVLIVVGDQTNRQRCATECPEPETCQTTVDVDGSPPHRELVDVVGDAFAFAGIATLHALWASEIRAGADWVCYSSTDCHGKVPDPKLSTIAAALTAAGVVTFGSKDELRELVAPESDEALARRSARIDALTDELEETYGPDRTSHDLKAVFSAIRRTAEGSALTEDDLLRVMIAVSDTRVRDVALGAALGESSGAAEQLWLTLVRKAPAPELADVASLLAFSAYLRGDGGLAGVALERVEKTRPEHRLGVLLRQALEAGIPPSDLSVIARDAAEDARLMIEEDGAW